ncbi:MAG: hypothetical protein JNM99_02060 [Verrucomicrobiaceae bacterium]|nr:hypothetical protein [Verrucomicrobiaceae bacterium]
MNLEAIKNLYEQNGFFWSPSLQEIALKYGFADHPFVHYPSGDLDIISFDVTWWLEQGPSHWAFEYLSDALSEEVAPIARETPESDGVLWAITKRDRLYAIHEATTYAIGDENETWETQLPRIFRGEATYEFAYRWYPKNY